MGPLERGINAANAGRLPEALKHLELARKQGLPGAALCLAHTLWAGGKRKRALAALGALIRKEPRNAPLHVMLGQWLQAGGDHAGALRAFEKSIRLDPKDTRARFHNAILLQTLKRWAPAARAFQALLKLRALPPRERLAARLALGAVYASCGKLGEAAGVYSKALSAAPASAEARQGLAHIRLLEANKALASHQLKTAEAKYAQAAKLKSRSKGLYFGRGECARLSGRHAEAARHYREEAALHGPGAQTLTALAKTLLAQGQKARARAELARALKVDGSSTEARILLAELGNPFRGAARKDDSPATRYRASLLGGDFAGAWESAKELTAGNPTQENYDAFFNPFQSSQNRPLPRPKLLEDLAKTSLKNPWPLALRVSLLNVLGRSEEALALARPLAQRSKRHPWMLYQIGFARLNAGADLKNAEHDFRRAAVPGLWKARAFLAEIRLCRGDQKRAFTIMDRLVNSLTQADRMRARTWRGGMRLWTGNYRAALEDLEAGRQSGAEFAGCWHAAALLMLGRKKEGLTALNAVLKTNPHDAEARLWRGEARRQGKDYRGALSDLKYAFRSGEADTWVLANMALTHLALGNRQEARQYAQAIRPEIRKYLERKAKPAPLKRFLETALKLARGLRRADPYLDGVWTRS